MSDEESRTVFQLAIGSRIDALESAVKDLESQETGVDEKIRRMARFLGLAASRYGYTAIEKSAKRVEAASDDELLPHLNALIESLRREAERRTPPHATLLIIGGDPDINDRLQVALSAPNREVIWVDTALEAVKILAGHSVVFIILNIFLPDEDGRNVLLQLRKSPKTASVPILIIDEVNAEQSIRESGVLLDADGYISSPIDVEDVKYHVRGLLRRAHETVKEALRDPLTGLMNKAAFYEHCKSVLKEAETTDEPVSLALVNADPWWTQEGKDEKGMAPPLHWRTSESGIPEAVAETKQQDEVLQRFALTISSSLRATDVLARLGGTEFAVLLPGEDQEGATQAMKKLRKIVGETSLVLSDRQEVCTTMSAGVVCVAPGQSLDEAVQQADSFLFQAKAADGDKVVSNSAPILRRKAKRVLLAVQNQTVAQVMQRLFEERHLDVVAVESGAEALAEAEGPKCFHLIILDENLSDGSGFDVLQKLRMKRSHKRIPIIMLVEKGNQIAVVQALELGASDYVLKPLSPAIFASRMHRLLTRATTVAIPKAEVRKVLIISSDTGCLVLAGTSLHKHGGFRVFLAKDEEAGLERALELNPDVVLVDMMREGIAPLDILRKMRAAKREVNASVIGMANSMTGQGIQDFLAAGGTGIVTSVGSPLIFARDVDDALGIPPEVVRVPGFDEELRAEIGRVT